MLAKIKQLVQESPLKKQFRRCEKLGWVKLFVEIAPLVCEGKFDAADLMAIASRETNLDPIWLTKPGDHGNGFGLMQADKRSFPDFVKTGKWKTAAGSIEFGARVLMEKYRDAAAIMGKTVGVKTLAGKSYSFVAKYLTKNEHFQVSIAAYNCGRWAHYHISKGNSVDRGTTQANYSADVIRRAVVFRKLINEWKMQNEIPALSSMNPAESAPLVTKPVSLPNAETGENAAARLPTLKEFSNKYLRHTPVDSVKNICCVAGSRSAAAITGLFSSGLTGKIFAVLLVLAIVAPAVYAAYYYRSRWAGWFGEILSGLIGE